jgi:hypothetical protein
MLTGLIVVPIPPDEVEFEKKKAALDTVWMTIAVVKAFKEKTEKRWTK